MTRDIKPIEQPTETIFESQVLNRYHMLVPLLKKTREGKDTYAACIPLTGQEVATCKRKAYADTLKEFGDKVPKTDEPGYAVWKELEENNYACYVLFFSHRIPDDLDKKLFLSKDQVMCDYTPVELGIMHSGYLTTEYNQPAIKHINPEDPNALYDLFDTISKQATVEETSFFFRSYTDLAQATLIKFLVDQLNHLQTASGGAIKPSNSIITSE